MTALTRLKTRYAADECQVHLQERSFSLTAGAWGGGEVRATRAFVWLGARATGPQRILSLHREPRLLRRSRRRRHLEIGPVQLSWLGNPLVTLTVFAVGALRARLLSAGGAGPSR